MPRPDFNPDHKFTPEAHERYLADRYAQLARYEAFDKMVDLALDGVITMEQALEQFALDELDTGTELL